MGSEPTALVIRTAGTNCDAELCRAFEMAGARVDLAHVDALSRDSGAFARADLIGFPGGFSYGDDIASGRILAARVRERLWGALRDAVNRGALVIGVCNGFQVLTQLGLLPGSEDGVVPESPEVGARSMGATLTDNDSARFIDRWVGVSVPEGTRCVWTRGLVGERGDGMLYPIAHGEGRFVVDSDATLSALESSGRVALRYTEPVNGSVGDIAGICDATGRVFGLMPHPERYLDWTHHPFWTRMDAGARSGVTPGLRVFREAVSAVKGGEVVGAV